MNIPAAQTYGIEREMQVFYENAPSLKTPEAGLLSKSAP
jgi:hypothetical protein